MITIALRFANNMAPACGTIEAHEEILRENGHVWYGKFGSAISEKVLKQIKTNEPLKVLLIHSGKFDRYWLTVDKISRECDNINLIPSYYREKRDKIKAWLYVSKIEPAPRNIISKCVVKSSGASLSEASSYSMSPYFVIEVDD